MKISVIGTGPVGRNLAAHFARLGHDVVMGTRDPQATAARTDQGRMETESFSHWHDHHRAIALVKLAQAGAHGEVIINATAGQASVAALTETGGLEGKILMDVSNPLDPSTGFPPTLAVSNTDSNAERLQREFPDAKVVKTLNTVANPVMVDPGKLPEPHTIFLAGEDADAKYVVSGLLQQLGWPEDSILDLGGIESARGMEMYLPLWLRLMGALGHADFNIKVVRGH